MNEANQKRGIKKRGRNGGRVKDAGISEERQKSVRERREGESRERDEDFESGRGVIFVYVRGKIRQTGPC